ncbi:hypothetical protein CHS0354_018478 [Potamilus streckersoni]|uniref:methylmalonate-semialdehyde dehydrogenase (CoA acylating) n=1 Tax=Potamilus streckersoni TaxID=2493646 RepID=A0AAE0WAA2_9BIVA|nr:hypothetical protein CHS0354_018478 [Potamilus streckersoni]
MYIGLGNIPLDAAALHAVIRLTNDKIIMNTVPYFINGSEYHSKSTRRLDIYNPALGKVIRQVAAASREDVDAAVKAALAAFPAWAATPPAKRAQVMFKFLHLINQSLNEFAQIVSEEHGKTIDDAIGSISRGIEVIEYCCGIPSHLKSDFTANVAGNVDAYNIRQPLGVCAGITPFNFPAMVPMWMFPVAISCGNTFVLKPSEKVPSASLFMARKLKEAGLPDGVFNVVVGDKEAVDAVLEHPDIQAVSFVGSTSIGQYIYQKGSQHNKRVQALCGAKNHMIVMPDADMEQATDALIGAAYGSAGERCMAISVAVAVGDEVADDLIARLTPRVKNLKVGAFDCSGIEMGPVVSKQSYDKINGYIETGLKEGAKLVVDGRGIKIDGYESGYFIGGCLFDRVSPDMTIYKEEIFGPVLSVVRVKDYETALKLVNDHEYGNGTAIFTRDGDTARHFSMNAKIGMVGINVPIPVPVAYHSFGGWKRSIFGGFAIHGAEGVRFYTKLKTITARWPSGIRSGSQFNFKRGSDA